jgi:hypothetical protein
MPPTNPTQDQEGQIWASRTATRLRVIQADFADRPAEERCGFIEDELDGALKEISIEKQPGYVMALAAHFPTATVVKQAGPEAKPQDNSPEALVEALVKVAPQLPKSLLADFGLRLQQAGYMAIKSTTLMDEPPEEIRKVFPLDPAQPVDIQRLYRALAVYAEFYIGLEAILWRIWHELAAKSIIRREPGDVKKLTARYLQGDREVAAEQLRHVIEKTRMLMGGLLGAIPAGAAAFMARFTDEFAPENVAALAKVGRGVGGWTEDARNWNQYKKLFEDRRGKAFEEQMYEALARRAESLMTGTGNRRET